MKLTAVYMQVPEGYIAFVEELPGANTQGDTLEEARENLREAVELVLEANRENRPARRPREGWDAAFRQMAREGDDARLDDGPPTISSWDEDEWEWR